jgi:ABC-2 type transport system ATP-binding protein
LTATDLRKRFGAKQALDGFTIEVETGTIHGLLGPNGAGKSTAVRILATLTRLDTGTATIAGIDVATSPAAVRERIGLVGQNPAVDEILDARQNLVLFGRLFGLSRRAADARASELLVRFALADVGSKPVSSFSGGMRRRLDIAASLILRPTVLFLDEPTTGLDPRGRNEVWSAVRSAAADGTTVLLTTQYLEEADQLASRISVMGAGRVVAEGTPDELKTGLGADLVSIVVHDDARFEEAVELLARIGGAASGDATSDPETRSASAPAPDGSGTVIEAIRAFDAAGIQLDDISLRRPTLDEVFLSITEEVAA